MVQAPTIIRTESELLDLMGIPDPWEQIEPLRAQGFFHARWTGRVVLERVHYESVVTARAL